MRSGTTNHRWGAWVEQARKRAGMTKRDVAKAGQFDPSYLTLIERDGLVPTRKLTSVIVSALTHDKCEQDVGMVAAGYAPYNVSFSELVDAVVRVHDGRKQVPR